MKTNKLQMLNEAVRQKLLNKGVVVDTEVDFTASVDALFPHLLTHGDWNFKRYNFHPWEVRNGRTDKSVFGDTLPIALCHAFLELL